MKTIGFTTVVLAAALAACAGNETKGGVTEDGWRSMPRETAEMPRGDASAQPMPPDTQMSRTEGPSGTTSTRDTQATGPSSIRLGAGGRAEGRLAVPKGGVASVGLSNRGPGRAHARITARDFGGEHPMFDGAIEGSVGATIQRGDEKTMTIVIEASSATAIGVELKSKAYGDPVPDIQWDLSRAGN